MRDTYQEMPTSACPNAPVSQINIQAYTVIISHSIYSFIYLFIYSYLFIYLFIYSHQMLLIQSVLVILETVIILLLVSILIIAVSLICDWRAMLMDGLLLDSPEQEQWYLTHTYM